jgi:hypothetical protein
MKSKLKLAAVAILLGTATAAAAQTPAGAQGFAAQFEQLQALSSVNPYTFKPAPVVGNAAPAPAREPFRQRFAEMQAAASNSGEYAFAPNSNAPAYAANSTLVAGRPLSIASIRRGR